MITPHGMCAYRAFKFAISTNQTNADLRTLALAAGWDGVISVVATVSSGAIVWGTTASASGLTVVGSFPHGVALIVSAGCSIYGGYGASGPGGYAQWGGASGGPGGTALAVSVPVSVTNNGTLAGGGGGGGGGGGSRDATGTVNSNGADGGTGAYATTAAVYLGGALGSAGGAGTPGLDIFDGNNGTTPGAGGAAGKSVSGNSYITWLATGTRTGPIT